VSCVQSKDACDLLEAGKAALTQGSLPVAYQYLFDALSIFHQVVGPMHKDTATVYGYVFFRADALYWRVEDIYIVGVCLRIWFHMTPKSKGLMHSKRMQMQLLSTQTKNTLF